MGDFCSTEKSLHNVRPLNRGFLTELIDKNGKEIYEGDFVYLSLFFHGETEINLISKGFIIWDGSKYIVKITESETDGRCLLYDKYDLSNFTNNDLEIISNIYEPPKLLKNETP